MLSQTTNLDLSPESQRRTFMETGYLIVEGDSIWGSQKAEIIKSCHNDISNLSRHAYTLVDEKLLAEKGPRIFVNDNEPRSGGMRYMYEKLETPVILADFSERHAVLKLANGVGMFTNNLKDATRHPKMLEIFSNLLSASEFEQIICQVHFKEPNDGVKFDPHVDIQNRINFDPNWQDVNGEGSYVIAIIAIDDHKRENGCLYTIPGIDPKKMPGKDIKDLKDYVAGFDLSKGIPLEMKAGDVLFMHPYNVHWSQTNTSDTSRYTLLAGMSLPGATKVDYPGVMCKLSNRLVSVNNLKQL